MSGRGGQADRILLAAMKDCAPRPDRKRGPGFRPMPCLGYPSKGAAAWALREQGLTLAEIAQKLNSSKSAVGNLIYDRSRRLERQAQQRPMVPANATLKVPVSARALRDLAGQANKRGITVIELVDRLLMVIAADALTDSILDDGYCGKGGAQ